MYGWLGGSLIGAYGAPHPGHGSVIATQRSQVVHGVDVWDRLRELDRRHPLGMVVQYLSQADVSARC